jgi:hypothetical protein
MNINTVKIQGSGYLLNGTMSVPMADGNSEYEAIKQWLAEGNTPEPEFTEAELAERELAKVKAEAQTYLSSTDWYVTRQSETGVVIPTDVLEARAKARELL